eukprot:TCONS_00042289-protein
MSSRKAHQNIGFKTATTLRPSIQQVYNEEEQQRKQDILNRKQQQQSTQKFLLRDHLVLHETVDQQDYQRLAKLMPLVKNRTYNINAPDEDWCCRSPLHVACSNGSIRCCQILLEHGAYHSTLTSSGITPAHFAAERGFLDILQLLFYYGANLQMEDFSKERPIDLAEKYNQIECVEFLK